ncbi:MAG: class I SAM-dependent methyltransferase [candidate division Zixibacteria bacterium]
MTPDKTSQFFDSYAVDFDAIYGGNVGLLKKIINRIFRKSMRLRFEKTIEECSGGEGRTVIDIGCGPGHYAVALASRGMRVTGIDFAPAMIEMANQKGAHAKVSDNCEFIVGDFIEYDFSHTFDYAVAMGFFDYIEKPNDFISKIISITRRKILMSFPRAEGFWPWQRRIRYKKRCPLYMYSYRQLDALLSPIDCRNYQIERISRDYFVIINLD